MTNSLKINDRVCIGNCQSIEENLAYYGCHAVVIEVSVNSARLDFEKWSKETGVKQDIQHPNPKKPKEWFINSILWKDNGTSRLVFQPKTEPYKTKDERRAEALAKAKKG